ncbi:acyltransferase [Bacillus luti]|uniref:acyltransferase family protein n=1 Tax=Bacillus luti TaxID=2026191 RepID=UPI0008FE03D6|nr:acyltransferase family protein [Bacillus luti]OJE53347.1 acyltransferase [Bacillus luti]
MEISKSDTKMLKGAAILLMLLLHLFGRKEVNGMYETFLTINGTPLIYYLALFGDACVPIYCFVSGYGLYVFFYKEQRLDVSRNCMRILKLLMNYWVVLVLFIIVGFFAGKSEVFSGGIISFFLNVFVLSSSYNGAWWFLQTYIILVFLAPLLTKLVRKYNSISLLLLFGAIYLVSYIQRIKNVLDVGHHTMLGMSVNAVVLVGTSLLPFIVGTIFAKEKIYSKIYNKCYYMPYKNILCAIGIIMLIVLHAFYESMIIAPFTAIAFISFFILMNKSSVIQHTLSFLGEHSTNIWLTHMFFYMSIFPGLIFAPRYPIIIFIWLITLCIASSYVINCIYKPIARMIDNKSFITRDNQRAIG